MNKKYLIKIVFFLVGIFLTGLVIIFAYQRAISQKSSKEEKITVVTSFYPLYFITSQLGGTSVEVINLTPAGSEPHDYDLTTGDIFKIKNSQLLVLNGGGMEVWRASLENSLGENNRTKIISMDALINQKIEENGTDKSDPHIWLDPNLAIQIAERIVENLKIIDSKNREYYQSNFNILKTELLALDVDFKKGLSDCKKRDILTSHDAFSYLAKAYNLNQISIAGLSPEEEPSIKKLTEIAQIAKDKNMEYIFFESLMSSKLPQTIADEIGAKVLVLNPIGSLTKDEIAQGENYFTKMRENLKNLKTALDCQ